jgi:hypothetical protein
MITQLLGSLRGRCGDDRRGAPRTRIDGIGELLACPATARSVPLQVQIRDISATGVGLVHACPLPLGQKYVVRQNSFTADQPRLYTVVRSDSAGDGTFSIGLHAAREQDRAAVPPLSPSSSCADSCAEPDPGNAAGAMMTIAVLVILAALLAMFLR